MVLLECLMLRNLHWTIDYLDWTILGPGFFCLSFCLMQTGFDSGFILLAISLASISWLTAFRIQSISRHACFVVVIHLPDSHHGCLGLIVCFVIPGLFAT